MHCSGARLGWVAAMEAVGLRGDGAREENRLGTERSVGSRAERLPQLALEYELSVECDPHVPRATRRMDAALVVVPEAEHRERPWRAKLYMDQMALPSSERREPAATEASAARGVNGQAAQATAEQLTGAYA